MVQHFFFLFKVDTELVTWLIMSKAKALQQNQFLLPILLQHDDALWVMDFALSL
jgi:hypothetical protein